MVIALLAAALIQAAPTVPAPAPPGQPPATMIVEPVAMAIAGFDADGDGRTTRAELVAGVRRSFAAIDTQHAGKLRFIDFAEWALRYLGDRNALPSPFDIDTDGDTAVSLAELQAALGAAFDRFDKDHDGIVTRAELLTIRATAADRAPARRGRR